LCFIIQAFVPIFVSNRFGKKPRKLGAYSLIIAHNHPSGDPKPSKKDIQVTRLLKQTGQIMGIRLDDHIVVGRVSTFSFYEQGYFTHNRY